ncbi:pseudouridine synthase [Luteimonas dalianensis]|uniref:pseudouridine synthase n=1 Tax=Luteimonas dalianensis TaxID=1148196 RepID=UPI003BF13418
MQAARGEDVADGGAGAGGVGVVYADSQLAVVSKPAGLLVHDSRLAAGESDFLVDRLRAQFGRRVFPAHRLDRATSGCLLLAFDSATAGALGEQLMSRTVGKEYLAVCRGWPEEAFTVDHPLDGGPGKPAKKPALTRFERLATAELEMPSAGFATSRYALLKASPETGRFRQIRRHLKHASHHLVGDTSHGDGRHNRNFRMLGIHRMLLHAWRLEFEHPGDGRRLAVSAPPDAQFNRALALFGAGAAERFA